MTIDSEHLRELFDSDLSDPQLVVQAGRAEVVAAGDVTGLVVASRADLLDQHGGQAPTGRALDELASRLDSAVTTMGG